MPQFINYLKKLLGATPGNIPTINAQGDLADSGTPLTNLATVTALASYLPLTGGTVTGNVFVSGVVSAIAPTNTVAGIFRGNGTDIVQVQSADGTNQISVDFTNQFAFNAGTYGPLYFGTFFNPTGGKGGFSVPGHVILGIDCATQRLGIGSTFNGVTPSAKLHVLGGSNEKQFIVQSNSTQTANIAEFQISNGNAVAAITPNGTYLGSNVTVTGTLTGHVDVHGGTISDSLNSTIPFGGQIDMQGNNLLDSTGALTITADTLSILNGASDSTSQVNLYQLNFWDDANGNYNQYIKGDDDQITMVVGTGGLAINGDINIGGGFNGKTLFLNSSTPGALANGLLWYDGTNLKFRTGSVTKTVTLS